ncbi:MAG: thioesterase [Deltaproteobacteria bacterium]|nr:thioesterase [Deltaproteobacteria bacterium]
MDKTQAETVRGGRTTNPWFPHLPRQRGRTMLFCLPPAGGGASLFRNWGKRLGPDIEVWPAHLPGRETRINDPFITDMAVMSRELAAAMRQCTEKPYAIFGHSMGAIVGFAAMAHLPTPPVRFFPSGMWPPDRPSPDPWGHLNDAELTERLRKLDGFPKVVLDTPEMREMLLPVVRADALLADEWVTPAIKVNCPITAFGGQRDTLAPAADVHRWAEWTVMDMEPVDVDGGHDFIATHEEQICATIRRHLG